MFPLGDRIASGLGPGLLGGIETEKQRRAVGPDQLGIVAGLVIDRQQVVAVIEDDRPAADHVPLVEREDRGVRPGLGVVARDLELNPRRRPGVAVPDDVKQPDDAIGGFPDDAVADRAERVVGDRLWAASSCVSPFLQPRAEDRRIDRIFARRRRNRPGTGRRFSSSVMHAGCLYGPVGTSGPKTRVIVSSPASSELPRRS